MIAGNLLDKFGGTVGPGFMNGIYFYGDARVNTPFGPRPDFGRPRWPPFIEDNVLMWLREFGVDGLRWDSTVNIRTTDKGRDPEGELLMAMPTTPTATPSRRSLGRSRLPRISKLCQRGRANHDGRLRLQQPVGRPAVGGSASAGSARSTTTNATSAPSRRPSNGRSAAMPSPGSSTPKTMTRSAIPTTIFKSACRHHRHERQ